MELGFCVLCANIFFLLPQYGHKRWVVGLNQHLLVRSVFECTILQNLFVFRACKLI